MYSCQEYFDIIFYCKNLLVLFYCKLYENKINFKIKQIQGITINTMLKSARILKRMSQKTLGKKLGISQSYVSRLENTEKYNKNVTVDLIKKLSKELDLAPIDLFLYFYNETKS